jgi:hypothetical protein
MKTDVRFTDIGDQSMRAESQFRATPATYFLHRKHLLVIAFLFSAAFGIRLYHINEPPLDFHPTRQYRYFLDARKYYYDALQSVPDWKKQIATINKQTEGTLEPTIMPFIVSFAYRVIGGEQFWIPRLLSSVFWLIGGGFLYLIGKRITGVDAAVFSTTFYLFLPFGVSASRSFQPDGMMIMMLLFSVFSILLYHERPSRFTLAVATGAAALAFLIKPVCLFTIIGAFLSLAIYKQGIRRAVVSPGFLVFTVISVLPTMIFYLYGIFSAGLIRSQAESTFLPYLFFDPFFWKNWLNNIGLVVGFTAFIGALLGTLMLRDGFPRALLIGLWIGYSVFCLAFNYSMAAHDYYQLQFVPIVALSIAPIGALVMDRLKQLPTFWRMAGWGILLLALLLSIVVARSRLMNPDFERKVRTAQEIGERVNHSTKNLFLSSNYGRQLRYDGELAGYAWPLKSDFEWDRLAKAGEFNAEERFNTRFLRYSPEYFIVEDLLEFEQQRDLKEFLSKFPTISKTVDYLIFDLRGK